MNEIDFFFYVDLETSGLDFGQDRIIEIGWHFADEQLHPISPVFASAISAVGATIDRINSQEYVREMHTATGLLGELLRDEQEPYLPRLREVEDDILDAMDGIEEQVNDDNTMIVWHPAGRSVHFDVRFIERFMPRLFKKLHHRILDIASLKLWLGALGNMLDVSVVGPSDRVNALPHRAGFDVSIDIAYIKGLREVVNFEQGVAVWTGDDILDRQGEA